MIRDVTQRSLIFISFDIAGLLIFIVAIKYYYRGSMKILKRQHQSYSCSAKDYTLEIQLSEKQTDYFINSIYPTNSRNRPFGEVYMEQFSKQLTSLLNYLYKKDTIKNKDTQEHEDNKELFEIATTFFCFHNKKIVTMLDKRGDQIREGNTEMIRAKSQDISEFFKKNNERYRRPVCAFVTFRSIKGTQIAKRLITESKTSVVGTPPKLFDDHIQDKCTRADNPSDIRWRNK